MARDTSFTRRPASSFGASAPASSSGGGVGGASWNVPAGGGPAVRATFKGFDEMLAKLNDLGDVKTIERISFRCTIAAAKRLREMAQVNAESDLDQQSGALNRGWAVKQKRNGSLRGYTVGMRFGKKGASIKNPATGKAVRDRQGKVVRDDPWYWWLLEFGTAHLKKKKGFGFFRRAIAQWMPGAEAEVMSRGRAEVQRAGQAALRRHGNGQGVRA